MFVPPNAKDDVDAKTRRDRRNVIGNCEWRTIESHRIVWRIIEASIYTTPRSDRINR